jgi:hypothetical protein
MIASPIWERHPLRCERAKPCAEGIVLRDPTASLSVANSQNKGRQRQRTLCHPISRVSAEGALHAPVTVIL